MNKSANQVLNIYYSYIKLIKEVENKYVDDYSEKLVQKVSQNLDEWYSHMENCFEKGSLDCINKSLDQGISLKTEIENAISTIKQSLRKATSLQHYEQRNYQLAQAGFWSSVFFGVLGILTGGLTVILSSLSTIAFAITTIATKIKLDKVVNSIIRNTDNLIKFNDIKNKFNYASDFFKRKFEEILIDSGFN